MELSVPRTLKRAAVIGAVLLLARAAFVQANGPAPTRPLSFSSTVEMVKVDVSVTDRRGRYVPSLADGDFTIFEDGVPQPLSLFRRDRLPVSVGVLIDCSSSMRDSLAAVKTAALSLVRELGGEDQAQIIQFNHRMMILQDFTSEAPLLERAVNAVRADGSTGLNNAVYITLKATDAQRPRHELSRRAIVLLTDGADNSSLVTEEQVLELAKELDVAVYVISLRGLQSESRERHVFFLNDLARTTGGRAYIATALDELRGVYDEIVEELHTQYTLGYVSTNPARENRYRRIAVRMGPQNLLVRHRPGYYPASGSRDGTARTRGTALRRE